MGPGANLYYVALLWFPYLKTSYNCYEDEMG